MVAVEYAVLQGFGGHSFGVPARFAQQLLREATVTRAGPGSQRVR